MAKDTNLCLCNNCNSILIDENPQVDAPLYDLKEYPEAKEMAHVWDDEWQSYFWACPECLTDSYLADDIK